MLVTEIKGFRRFTFLHATWPDSRVVPLSLTNMWYHCKIYLSLSTSNIKIRISTRIKSEILKTHIQKHNNSPAQMLLLLSSWRKILANKQETVL